MKKILYFDTETTGFPKHPTAPLEEQPHLGSMNFADQIRDERKRLGLTQAGADAVLDTCRGQVAAWESGRNTPHVLTQEGALARLRNRKTPRK